MTWTCRCGHENTEWVPCRSCLNPPPAVAPPPEPSRRRAPVWLTIVTVVVLLAGLVGAVVVDPPAPTVPAGHDGGGAPTGAAAAEMKTLVADLSRFVEQARGLDFKRPVEVVLLDGPEFRNRLEAVSELDPDELEVDGKVLRAFGLLEPGVDVAAAVEDLLGAAVVGFYDPESEELVVRGAEITPGVEITIVHELTHALQDQHFELHRPELDERDDESSLAFSGLVEGDAVRIQNLYRDTLSAEEIKDAEREGLLQAAAIGGNVPDVLIQLLTFPYQVGPRFVAALAEAGPERVDAAFHDPPTTSEHLLHPELFLTGDPAAAVAEPDPGGPVIDEGALGQFGLLLLFSQGLDDPATAFRAAEGWGGDWYVAWDEGARACVRTAITMDTPDDESELRGAVDQWARAHGNVTVAPGRPLTFTACG